MPKRAHDQERMNSIFLCFAAKSCNKIIFPNTWESSKMQHGLQYGSVHQVPAPILKSSSGSRSTSHCISQPIDELNPFYSPNDPMLKSTHTNAATCTDQLDQESIGNIYKYLVFVSIKLLKEKPCFCFRNATIMDKTHCRACQFYFCTLKLYTAILNRYFIEL